MIRHNIAALAALACVSQALVAQDIRRIESVPGAHVYTLSSKMTSSLTGLTVSASNNASDTLGLLVSSVAAGSAAAKAGIAEGNRITAINGVNVKVHPADAGQPDMNGIMSRRFQRESSKLRAGDSFNVTVAGANGETRTVTVQTEAPQPLSRYHYAPSGAGAGADDANRATLGAIVGGNVTKRDSLGVLVVEIAEDGPLAKAGVFEGSRIAAIGNVDLRVTAAAAGDAQASSKQVDLLLAELGKLTPGAKVELRVYDGGRFRSTTVETMRRQDVRMPPGAAPTVIRRGGQGMGQLEFISPNGSGDFTVQLRGLNDSALRIIDRHVLDQSRVEKDVIERIQRSLQGLERDFVIPDVQVPAIRIPDSMLESLRVPLMYQMGRRIAA